jgi:peptidoglycan/LPS O-acetylase OafA/YrhL
LQATRTSLPATHPIDYRRHIASLDGLRGLAIGLVFLHHFYPRQPHNPLSMLASTGWVGVAIFFVLSGFLITGILVDTLHKPHNLRNFFARRFLRLLPVYVLMIGLVFAFARPLQLPLTWKDIPFFAYAANFCTLFHIMPGFGPNLSMNHIWSLAVEEQFYLLWAPLVVLLARRTRLIGACLLGIAVAILLRGVGALYLPGLAVYQSLFCRMDSLLCGGLLALTLRGPNVQSWLHPRRLHWIFTAGLLILGAGFVASHSLFGQTKPTLIVGYIGNDLWCTALLGLALLPGTIVNRALNLSAVRSVGRYSYGLYVFHEILAPIFTRWVSLVQRLFHPSWLSALLGTASLFLFCLAVAMVSYHCVELPFLHLKRFFSYDAGVSAHQVANHEESIDLRPAQPSL